MERVRAAPDRVWGVDIDLSTQPQFRKPTNVLEPKLSVAYINRIATAVPPHDVHPTFLRFAVSWRRP